MLSIPDSSGCETYSRLEKVELHSLLTEIEDFVLREALVVWHRTYAVDLQTKLVLAKLEQ
jgi:hypothetical protein